MRKIKTIVKKAKNTAIAKVGIWEQMWQDMNADGTLRAISDKAISDAHYIMCGQAIPEPKPNISFEQTMRNIERFFKNIPDMPNQKHL
jgi:hypothetical protein